MKLSIIASAMLVVLLSFSGCAAATSNFDTPDSVVTFSVNGGSEITYKAPGFGFAESSTGDSDDPNLVMIVSKGSGSLELTLPGLDARGAALGSTLTFSGDSVRGVMEYSPSDDEHYHSDWDEDTSLSVTINSWEAKNVSGTFSATLTGLDSESNPVTIELAGTFESWDMSLK